MSVHWYAGLYRKYCSHDLHGASSLVSEEGGEPKGQGAMRASPAESGVALMVG